MIDPNASLHAIRRLCLRMQREIEVNHNTAKEPPYNPQVEELIYLFLDFDAHLVNGGTLPEDWNAATQPAQH